MRSEDEVARVLGLVAAGQSDKEIAVETGIPRTTVSGWRRGKQRVRPRLRRDPGHPCGMAHDFASLPPRAICLPTRSLPWRRLYLSRTTRRLAYSDNARFHLPRNYRRVPCSPGRRIPREARTSRYSARLPMRRCLDVVKTLAMSHPPARSRAKAP